MAAVEANCEPRPSSGATSTGTPTPRPETAPANAAANAAASGGTFESTFKAFAKFGDCKSTGEGITLSNSDKWFKQAKVIDGKKVTTTDTGICFKQFAKNKKALNLKEYNHFLESFAKNKKIEVDQIKDKLASSGIPSTTKTTATTASGAVARLTDHTKYTGTHKQRFDESGKGKGKAGRQDVLNETGYVQGYKEATGAGTGAETGAPAAPGDKAH